MSDTKPLPFKYQFLAGAIAGVSEICVLYPLDVVKTRFQLQVGTGGKDGYTSIADCFKRIVRREGYGALYRGILAPIMVEAPKRAIKFSANEQYGRLFRGRFGMKDGQGLSILTGVSAGATEAVVVTSFELVKIRMQDKANAGKYNTTVNAIRKIYQEEGILAFSKGLEATVWRHAVWNGGYFGVIHAVRGALPEAETKHGLIFRNFTAGLIGGTVGTALNTPFDVAKTRVQGHMLGQPVKYGWTLPAVGIIAKEEGLAALYKGFAPKVLRLGPGGGILLVVFDFVSTLIRKHLM